MRCNRGVSISIWMVILVTWLAGCVGSPVTQMPSPTLAATSSPAATVTITPVPAETRASPTPEMAFTSMSPDGTWVAQGVAMSATDAGTRHVWLDVSKTDGSVEWRVVDEWAEQALGQTTPRPFAWSRDGRYLYFTNFGIPDGCPGFVNGSDLQRVDLSDGSLTEVVPGVGFWLALALDESKLAYAGYGGRGLVVRDLVTGEEREVTLESDVEGAKLGHIVWSPDGTKLMLTAGFNLCGPPEERMHSIIRVDLSEGSHSTLIDRDSRLFSTQAWHAPGYVLLADKDEHRWEMSVDTGEATQIESTGCPSISASLDERVSHADWIFSGRVEKIEFLDAKKPESWMGLHHYEPRIIVRFSVSELWKGTPGTEEITLHTRYNAWSFNNARWLSSCSGFPFEDGEEYLVFAYRHNEYSRPLDAPNPFEDLPEDALDTSIWAGTKRLEDAMEDVLLFLPTGTPTSVSATDMPTPIPQTEPPASVSPTDTPTPVLPTDTPKIPNNISRIVFASGSSIYTVDVSANELTRIAQVDELLCCPRWSPDRQRIAFAIGWGNYYGVYVMNADGSDLRRLTYIRRTDGDRPPLAPVWSQDGQQIDFVYGAYGYGGVNTDSSPDGQRTAFVVDGYELYVKNADGTDVTKLITTTESIFGIDW